MAAVARAGEMFAWIIEQLWAGRQMENLLHRESSEQADTAKNISKQLFYAISKPYPLQLSVFGGILWMSEARGIIKPNNCI